MQAKQRYEVESELMKMVNRPRRILDGESQAGENAEGKRLSRLGGAGVERRARSVGTCIELVVVEFCFLLRATNECIVSADFHPIS